MQLAINLGANLVGRVKAFLDFLHPGHGLTDDQINALELAAQADDDVRIARRTSPDDTTA